MIIFNLPIFLEKIFNKMAKILQRIKNLTENEGITIGKLERVIGASKGVLSRAINNDTDIQAKWLEIIADNYPHYSAEWLLTGKGAMLKTDSSSTPPGMSPLPPSDNTISILLDRIDSLTRDNERLLIELKKYRPSSPVGDQP